MVCSLSPLKGLGCVVLAVAVLDQPSAQAAPITFLTFSTVVKTGDRPEGADRETFRNLGGPSVNASGQIAFAATLGNAPDDKDSGIFRAEGSEPTQQAKTIAREGSNAPFVGVPLSGGDFIATLGNDIRGPVIADVGSVAYRGTFFGPTIQNDEGVFVGTPTSGNPIALEGESPSQPAGLDPYISFFSVSVADGGTVAFEGTLDPPMGPFGIDVLATASDGVVFEEGDPRNALEFESFSGVDINDAGQLAYKARFRPKGSGAGTPATAQAVEIDETALAIAGLPAPGVAGAVYDEVAFAAAGPELNDNGEVVFVAQLEGQGIDASNNSGLFFGSTLSSMSLIAREGDAVPDLDQIFLGQIGDASLNDLGDLLFTAELTGPNVGPRAFGLFRRPAHGGIETVARTGDTLMIDGLGPLAVVRPDIGRDAINDAGQIAFAVNLENNVDAILLATPTPVPLPPSALALGVGLGLLAFVRARRGASGSAGSIRRAVATDG